MLDVIICANFGVEKLRGLGNTRGQILEFPIEMAGHLYKRAGATAQPVMALAVHQLICHKLLHVVMFHLTKGRRLRAKPVYKHECLLVCMCVSGIMIGTKDRPYYFRPATIRAKWCVLFLQLVMQLSPILYC